MVIDFDIISKIALTCGGFAVTTATIYASWRRGNRDYSRDGLNDAEALLKIRDAKISHLEEMVQSYKGQLDKITQENTSLRDEVTKLRELITFTTVPPPFRACIEEAATKNNAAILEVIKLIELTNHGFARIEGSLETIAGKLGNRNNRTRPTTR